MFTTQKIEPEVRFGDFMFKLELQSISDQAKEVARLELRETEENVERGVEELRKLLREEKTLDVPLEYNEWLLGFLRICKFYPENARERIKSHYKYRQRYPDIFTVCTPKRVKHVFESNSILILPKRDQYGRRIILMRSGKYWDHKKIHKDEFFMAAALCHELCRMEPNTVINGIVAITDMAGLSMEQAMQFTPSYSKRNVESYRDGATFRPKDLHFINEPAIFHRVFNLVRPFMSKKLSKRTHFHGSNVKSLHEFIAPECLPECYGGTMKLELDYGAQLYAVMSLFEEDFENNLKYGFKKK
ncbi:alpha-tocopherol transfer protein-like [Musca domestica]|uniref:Alpha-tocopherol transfer protein-like n=1 Tax=Musca domestica TaxID=7370 RepID=A0ABM3VQQ6_MUSDO|nr:alpha-tocopherol transfer protein-like [Musca domestica]